MKWSELAIRDVSGGRRVRLTNDSKSSTREELGVPIESLLRRASGSSMALDDEGRKLSFLPDMSLVERRVVKSVRFDIVLGGEADVLGDRDVIGVDRGRGGELDDRGSSSGRRDIDVEDGEKSWSIAGRSEDGDLG
jgi:hypothetical protein